MKKIRATAIQQEAQDERPGPEMERPDLHMSALGAGCVTNIVCLALSVGSVLGPLAARGLDWKRLTPQAFPTDLRVSGFLLGLGTYFLTGFVTAAKARTAKMFNALIIGIFAAGITVVGLMFSGSLETVGFWGWLSWFLMVPLILLGGRVAARMEPA